MADLVITAANVLAGANAMLESGKAGETIAQGKAVYRDESTKKFMLADNNSATPAARKAYGIALVAAANNQPMVVHRSGDLVIGAAVVAGTAYYLSDTPGGICAIADLAAGEYICHLGYAINATTVAVDIQFPNVAVT